MLKTVSSVINTIGALNYKGTWNASTNSPTLVSSVGTKGDYYVVSVSGSTNLNGITDWVVSDWCVFNGSVWQKVDNSEVIYVSNVATGTGLTGGPITTTGTIALANTAVTAGSYGTANAVSQVTIDAQGRITSASNVAIAIANSAVSGLGTMAIQNANAVAITAGNVVANVTVTNTTAASATFGTSSLPLTPAGYIQIQLANATVVKVPYYAS
jgi:hypothetical protein